MTVSIVGVILPAAARVGRHVPAGLRRIVAVLVAAALLAGVAGPVVAHPTSPRTEEDEQEPAAAPLAVTIASMSPATVPRRGTITLTGEIRNRSRSTWTDLNVYLFASSRPMTTRAELAEATASDETLDVGARVTAPGSYDEVPDLAPGETASYRLSVPRRDLPFADPGVYWIGVHVLGSNEEGRLDGADGRARTFVPLMPERTTTTLSLVLPLRAAVRRTQEGRLADPARWARRLGEDGRLGRLTALGATGFGVPLTWVVDPAVLDAAASLADGNPAFDLAPTGDGEESPGATDEPDTPLTESPGPDGDEDGVSGGEDPESELAELSEEAETAGRWLEDFVTDAAEQEVLALPYGDVDMAALLRGDFDDTAEHAQRLGSETADAVGLDTDPVVAPLSGLLPEAALENLDPDLPLLLSERAADTDATRVRLRQGSDAVLTDEVARVGGPGPNPRFGALALRQQILAAAAVHGLTYGPGRPLVVSMPEQWDPRPSWRSATFFSGLTTPWLRMVPLSMATAMSQAEEYDGPLAYTRAERRAEVPIANVLATQELGRAGGLLASLLDRNDTIDEQVARAAMLGIVGPRAPPAGPRPGPDPGGSPSRCTTGSRRSTSRARDLVTMSSETGNLAVTVVNDLPEPVTVGLDAQTGTDELRIRTPDLVSLGPGQRATVRLAVRATDTGVHSVRLVPTTEDGRPLGRSTMIRVRSSQVGLVIWVIMGTGAVVFLAAIGARVARRLRRPEGQPLAGCRRSHDQVSDAPDRRRRREAQHPLLQRR